jgi:hypothetical protein
MGSLLGTWLLLKPWGRKGECSVLGEFVRMCPGSQDHMTRILGRAGKRRKL